MPHSLTLTGNLVREPELRFTPSGASVANFTVADTERVYDREAGEWKDGDKLFMNCSVWREQAERVAGLTVGTRVTVTGTLRTRNYETKEGDKRTVTEMKVTEVSVSMIYADVAVTKVNSPQRGSAPRAATTAPATAATTTDAGPGKDNPFGEPPF